MIPEMNAPRFGRTPKAKTMIRFRDPDDLTQSHLFTFVRGHRRPGGRLFLLWQRLDNGAYYVSRLKGNLWLWRTRLQLQGSAHLRWKRRYAADLWRAQQHGPDFAERHALTPEGRTTLNRQSEIEELA